MEIIIKHTITCMFLAIAIKGYSQNNHESDNSVHQSYATENVSDTAVNKFSGNSEVPNITYRVFENPPAPSNSLKGEPPAHNERAGLPLQGAGGWGYEALIDNRVYVHQEHIPAIPGNKGFATKKDAEKTAQLVIIKIEKGIMPPSITPQELDSLGVIKKEE